MNKRALGKNGPLVSPVGLGCWSFAGAYGPTDETESHETLAKALDLGVDFLDTANVYGAGVSEQVIGSFIAKNPNQFRIATKGGIQRAPGSTERVFNNSSSYLRECLEKSLKNLGVDYVDLYYIHRRDPNLPIEEVMETLVAFKNEGKIGGIGFSEIAPSSLRRAHAVHPVAAVQSEYSLWTRGPELGMVQACEDLGVTFVPFSPVGRGMFGQNAPDPGSFSKIDFRKNNPRFLEPNFSYNLKAIDQFRIFAADKGLSPATLALAWILNRNDTHVPIPGTRSASHLSECAAAGAVSLTPDDLAEIEALLPVGFAHGDRYSDAQLGGAERYC
ncbi:aldo/keto reductase [Sneathiella marina]|uniref:Aldo/keto reductase n=1 Tax=Sneathiella marina TaxID=2950108 RepID=A0ABY4W7I9_9PROT|nr:aldo/keto reductase [Sneathiella marina]USG63133.1 aldo/keto reductase [Sneathiella marina]